MREGDLQALARLHEAGSDIDQLDRHGQTAIDLAIDLDHSSVVEALKAKGY